MLAQRWQESLGQSVVVDNRAGAGGNIGAEIIAKSPPDGYNVLFTTSAIAANVTLYPKMGFDPRKSLIVVSHIGSVPALLTVHPSVPAKTARDVVALSKATKGGMNFGSNGSGTTSHLAGAMFVQTAGAALTHVPYKGAAPALNEILGGHVEFYFTNPLLSFQHAKTGRLRALAVSGARRAPALPDMPTVAEAGVSNFEVSPWYGVMAPARTPAALVAMLARQINDALTLPELREKLAAEGAEPAGTTPDEFARIIAAEYDKWSRVIRATGIRAD